MRLRLLALLAGLEGRRSRPADEFDEGKDFDDV